MKYKIEKIKTADRIKVKYGSNWITRLGEEVIKFVCYREGNAIIDTSESSISLGSDWTKIGYRDTKEEALLCIDEYHRSLETVLEEEIIEK